MKVPALFEAHRAVLEDAALAGRLYRAIAEAGDPRAWVELGRMACDRSPPDPSAALEAFERAAVLGSSDGALQAAFSYLHGDGTPKDASRALELFVQAAAGGSSIAATRAGVITFEQDPARAIELWRSAVALDEEPEAMLWLGRAHDAGRGTLRSVGTAVRWFRRCAVESTKLAKRATSPARRETFYDWVDEGLASVRRLEPELRAGALEDGAAAYELAMAIGAGMLEEDDDNAVVLWLRVAVEADHAEACWRLAHRHRTGNGVLADMGEFEQLLRRAATAGLPDALHDLGYAAESGGFGNRELDAAIEAYRRAVGSGSTRSLGPLASLLEERGRPEDHPEATARWIALAERGDVEAMLTAARRHRDGVGVSVDLVQATRWFWCAHRHGRGDGVHELHGYVRRMTPDQLREADRLAGGDGSHAASAIDAWL